MFKPLSQSVESLTQLSEIDYKQKTMWGLLSVDNQGRALDKPAYRV